MMTFQEKLQTGRFVVTAEVAPPKGISLEKILRQIEGLKDRLDAFNITDLQSSCLRMSALAAALLLKNEGFEPVLQMTCRDRNRLALQADLLGASGLGITNILALTGDHPSLGDHPEAKAVYDLDSTQLLDVIRGLEGGRDQAGNQLLEPYPEFFPGAVVNPGADPLEPELIKMEKKLEAGAEFFQTQAVFDIASFEKFLEAVRPLKTRIIAGIVLLKSERMAQYLNDHVPGIHVPQDLIAALAGAPDKTSASIEISASLVRRLKGLCQGVHLMPISWYSGLPLLLDSVGDLS